jgi:hypothetical protein
MRTSLPRYLPVHHQPGRHSAAYPPRPIPTKLVLVQHRSQAARLMHCFVLSPWLQALDQYGPMAVYMAANCDTFFGYTGGILTTDCLSGKPDQQTCSVSKPAGVPRCRAALDGGQMLMS